MQHMALLRPRFKTVPGKRLSIVERMLPLFLLAGMLFQPVGYAQELDTLAFLPISSETSHGQAPRVFLDCRQCDELFLRREIPFVDYVRDRQVADVHLLITEQRTGSGGSVLALNFIGQKGFLGVDQRLVYTSASGTTRDEERMGLAHRMKLGLIPYASQTAVADQIGVSYTPLEEQAQPVQQTDPWRSWVFEVSGDGSFNGEATRRSYYIQARVSADRVTETWKIRARAYVDYNERRFESGEEIITSSLESREVNASVVYSLARHWSAGLFSEAYSTTYDNIDLGFRAAPALEYSVFPYEESSRKELTFAYRVGYQSVDYIEETIFGRTSESRPNESLTARLQVTQPWGNMFIQLEGSHYFHDFSKNRLEFFSVISVRLFRGLSVRVSGGLEIIHDQLYLPRGEGTLEDLLLQQKQLATTYQYRGSVGISYTFGSIFSNVVNTRL